MEELSFSAAEETPLYELSYVTVWRNIKKQPSAAESSNQLNTSFHFHQALAVLSRDGSRYEQNQPAQSHKSCFLVWFQCSTDADSRLTPSWPPVFYRAFLALGQTVCTVQNYMILCLPVYLVQYHTVVVLHEIHSKNSDRLVWNYKYQASQSLKCVSLWMDKPVKVRHHTGWLPFALSQCPWWPPYTVHNESITAKQSLFSAWT